MVLTEEVAKMSHTLPILPYPPYTFPSLLGISRSFTVFLESCGNTSRKSELVAVFMHLICMLLLYFSFLRQTLSLINQMDSVSFTP
jgi:hypothetical protein